MSGNNKNKDKSAPEVAPYPREIDATKVTCGERQSKPYSFPKDGKQIDGTKYWIELKYDGHALSFSLQNMKSSQGLKVEDNRRGWMSMNLKKETSQDVRENVDDAILRLILKNASSLGANFTWGREKNLTIDMLRMLYKPIAKPGNEKKDKPGECWEDQVTGNLDLRKGTGGQVEIDQSQCKVEDSEGMPYLYLALENRPFDEVVLHVPRVILSNNSIKPEVYYRLIVLNSKPPPTFTTKRRLEHKEAPTAASSSSADAPPRAAPAPAVSEESGRASKKPKV